MLSVTARSSLIAAAGLAMMETAFGRARRAYVRPNMKANPLIQARAAAKRARKDAKRLRDHLADCAARCARQQAIDDAAFCRRISEPMREAA